MRCAFVSVLLVCFGELAVILYTGVFARVYVPELGLLRGNFQCPLGQQFTVAIYACAFTCACSFTLPSVWGVLLSFLFFFSEFVGHLVQFGVLYCFYLCIVLSCGTRGLAHLFVVFSKFSVVHSAIYIQ